MNRASVLPAVFRMVTLGTVPLITYFGVTEYNKLNKIELPELPIEKEIEPEIVTPTETQKRTRRVWRQTAGRKFGDVFSSLYTSYKYTEGQLNTLCTKYDYQIFRNWCKEAKFEIKEEEEV